MQDNNNLNNIVPFKKKELNNDVNNLEIQDTEIIDFFSCKNLIKKSKYDKKLSNQYFTDGISLFQNGLFDKAFDNFLKAEDTGCDYIDLYLYLSRCYGMNKDIEKSLYYANKAVEADKDCSEAYYLLIIGHIFSEKVTEETFRLSVKAAMLNECVDDVIYYFAALFFLDDKHYNFVQAKKYIMSAIDYLQYEIAHDKPKYKENDYRSSRLNKYFRLKAKCCFYLKEYDDALTLYSEAEKNDKTNLEVYLHMSVIYSTKSDNEAALENINRAFDLYNAAPAMYTNEVYEYMNYVKGLVLARLNDNSYLDFLVKGRKFFPHQDLLDSYLSRSKKLEKLSKKLEKNIVDIAKNLIAKFSDDEINDNLDAIKPFANSLLEALGADDYAKIIAFIEKNNSDDEVMLKLLDYMKSITKE